MATLVERINDLAVAIRVKINQIMPRLPIAGGSTGQVMTKASGTDYSFRWSDVFSPTNLMFGNGLRQNGSAVSTTGAIAFAVSGKPTSAQVLATFYLPFPVTADANTCGGAARAAATASYSIYLKRAGVTMVTWTWVAGASSATVAVTTASLAAGNYTLEAQTTADTTLDSPSPTLGFFR